MRKNNCCKVLVDAALRRITESGIIRKLVEERIYLNTVENFNRNPIPPDIKARPITLEHLKGPFAFLAIGHFLSLLVFMFEVCVKKKILNHLKAIKCIRKKFEL